MTDDSVSRYFEFYRVNLNGEKKIHLRWGKSGKKIRIVKKNTPFINQSEDSILI
jgi:hypothetical protein